jgi:hypothetical protein
MPALRVIVFAGLYLAACEILEFVIVRRHGADAFPPKMGWRLIRWIVIAVAIVSIGQRFYEKQSQLGDAPLWLTLCFLLLGAVWPRTVLVDNDGISSCSTFGFRHCAIPWTEVSKIASDWEEVSTRFGFRFMGTRIYVLSRSGTRITHGVVQSRQGKFLDDLRRYLPRTVFEVGLYDWQPSGDSKVD